MVVLSGLGECAEMTHALRRPELSRAFEAALSLPASRLDGSRANGPAASVDGPVVHPACMGRKIVLLTHHHFVCVSLGDIQGGDRGKHFPLTAMPQLVA
jgi:hypothetical protein